MQEAGAGMQGSDIERGHIPQGGHGNVVHAEASMIPRLKYKLGSLHLGEVNHLNMCFLCCNLDLVKGHHGCVGWMGGSKPRPRGLLSLVHLVSDLLGFLSLKLQQHWMRYYPGPYACAPFPSLGFSCPQCEVSGDTLNILPALDGHSMWSKEK